MSVAAPTRADPTNCRPTRGPASTLIVVYLSLGGLAFSVLQSLVAPALSTIGTALGASTTDVARPRRDMGYTCGS